MDLTKWTNAAKLMSLCLVFRVSFEQVCQKQAVSSSNLVPVGKSNTSAFLAELADGNLRRALARTKDPVVQHVRLEEVE